MCPLRIILIFLSATLAGFFVLRNLRSQPQPTELDDDGDAAAATIPTNSHTSDSSNPSSNRTSKVRAAVESGFWTFVDMASGRYLWRQLVNSSSTKKLS